MPLQDSEISLVYTELTTDPQAYGYAPHIAAGNHQILADLLNSIDLEGSSIPKDSIPIHEIHNHVDETEYDTLVANAFDSAQVDHLRDRKRYQIWHTFITAHANGEVYRNGSNVVAILRLVWNQSISPLTWANLVALQTRPANRVESPVVLNREYIITPAEVVRVLQEGA